MRPSASASSKWSAIAWKRRHQGRWWLHPAYRRRGRPHRRNPPDIRYLRRLWEQIGSQIQTCGAPLVIYEDLGLALRTLRDLVNPKIEKIRIDSRETFQKTTQFVAELMPEIADRLEHYPGERPIFDLYGVEDEIQRARSARCRSSPVAIWWSILPRR